ncbi:hypothetical protein LTR08_006485 [Meristemomyces frigidus]|nr:hypothetical protein LTR08_006485 [Meristemomyces frigidus]
MSEGYDESGDKPGDKLETHDISEGNDESGDKPGDRPEDKPKTHRVPETEEQHRAILTTILDTAPDGPVGTDKGLLSLIGDPLGRVLNIALRPIGYITGAIGRPHGEALLAVEKRAKEEFGYVNQDHTKEERQPIERVGGKPQNGQNPLGL